MVAEPIVLPTDLLAVEPTAKAFRRDGMGYLWERPDGVLLRVDYLGLRNEELTGEIEVQVNGKHLHLARFNLSSTTARGSLVRVLSGRTASRFNWDQILEQFCVGVIRGERRGEPTQRTFDAPLERTPYLLEHLIQKGKANMLFGPGGAGKGYISVAACVGMTLRRGVGPLTVLPATPFYFDWEDDFATFNGRVKRVCNGLGVAVPDISYRRMHGLLSDRINEMARNLADAGAEFAVIDSVSAAAGQVGERGSWDMLAHRLFDALLLVPNMTWLLIDHIAGDGLGADIAGKAFGSIQKMNRARNAWEMRSQSEPDGQVIHATLFHTKFNHVVRETPIRLTLRFVDDGVTIEKGEVIPTAGQATKADTIAAYLSDHGPASVRAIELGTRLTADHIRAELSRYGTNVRGGTAPRFVKDGDGNWDVASREHTAPEEIPW